MLSELAAFDPFFASRYAGNAKYLPENVTDLKDGDVIDGLEVMLLPGHTPGGAGFFAREQQMFFCGDTVFAGSAGRVDLGGNEKQLLQSIEKIKTLPSSTMLLPGHGAATSVEAEKASNPYFKLY
jgi:Zn-dependent hydrolases, including glyoxylases